MTVSASQFSGTPLAPPDPIFNLTASYKADTNANKINLGVGAYRTEDETPWVLPVVHKAERMLLDDARADHEYLPIEGLPSFTQAAAKLVLGKDSAAIAEGRFAACQAISGTGALRLGAEFLAAYRKAPVFISKPTWANHRNIFANAGMEVREYRYWDAANRGLDERGLIQDFTEAPEGSILVLHACAHNPTGVDPTDEQWEKIAQVVRAKKHFVFFDCAYQGFASGDVDRDAHAVRFFVARGFELFVAQSFSKNFGLYGERTGCLTAVAADADASKRILSQLARLSRASISNPPAHGARIVSLALNDPVMNAEWLDNVKTMAGRIQAMRQLLRAELERLGTPGRWNHITEQIGMFSFTGITPAQARRLIDEHHVYLTDNGRISMAGLTTRNVARFAQALDAVVRQG